MKLSWLGLTAMLDAGPSVTTNVTLMLCGLPVAPGAVMVTVPLYVPAAKLAGFTETLTVPELLPLLGVADNHVPPTVATE